MPKKTIVPCSGGMDSVGLVWKLLHETDEIVVVQHVRHNCFYKHWESEEEAFTKCMKYIKAHSRPFTILPTMEYEAVGSTEYRTLPHIVGAICALLNDADCMVSGTIADDLYNSSYRPYSEQKTVAAKALFKALVNNKNITRDTPLKDFYKKEWWNILPLELLDMTTTCKHPTLVDGKWVQCNICNSCKGDAVARYNIEPVPLSERVQHWVKYDIDQEIVDLGRKDVVLFVPTLEHDNILYLYNMLLHQEKHVLVQPIELIETKNPAEDREKMNQVLEFLEMATRKFKILPPIKFTLNVDINDYRLKELVKIYCVGNAAIIYKDHIEEAIATYPTDRRIKEACEYVYAVTVIDDFRPKGVTVENITVSLPDRLKEILDY